MVPSPAAPLLRMAHALQCIVNGDDSAVFPVLSLVTLTFDLDIQTRPSEGSKTSSLQIWCKSVEQFQRYE